ncbi:MAG: transcriptional repressor [Nitrospirae bacterium]|nr:transcriptional repressor [Nitrospirota bacterium]
MDRDEARDILFNFIKEKSLRYTRQREEILQTFLSAGRHITVEELYNVLRKKNTGIGYATVHRNLKLMKECGLADEMKIGSDKTRFEQAYGQRHHDHLICMKCGRIIEVNDDRIERLQDKLAEVNNFFPLKHKLEIYGSCKKCR